MSKDNGADATTKEPKVSCAIEINGKTYSFDRWPDPKARREMVCTQLLKTNSAVLQEVEHDAGTTLIAHGLSIFFPGRNPDLERLTKNRSPRAASEPDLPHKGASPVLASVTR